MSGTTVIWVMFGVCLVLSFLLSGMEAGVFALSRLRIRQQMRSGRASARVLHHFLENPENFLWTILVGNTVANFLILGWAVTALHLLFRRHQVWFAVVFCVIVFFFYTFFDLLPKMLFRMFPNRLCMILARPFALIHLVLWPLVALVEWFSGRLLKWRGGKVFTGHLFGNREELRLVMQESAQALSTEEKAMINRVLDLQALTVRQVVKPFDQAVTVMTTAPLSQALELCRDRKLTRLPVWEQREADKRIVGLLSLNPLLYQDGIDSTRPVGEFVAAALYLEEDLRLEVALRRMQRSGQRLAIVLGRERKEIGILTLQDVLRLIFGEVSL